MQPRFLRQLSRSLAVVFAALLLAWPGAALAQAEMGQAFSDMFKGDDEKAEEEAEEPAEPPPEMMGDVDEAAVAEEKQELAAFLTREPLGFNLETLSALREDVEIAGDKIAATFERFGQANFIEKLKRSAPVQLIILFFITLWLLDRRAKHLRREIWDMLPPLSSPLLDNLLDSALRVMARTLPIIIVILPAYFPLKGIFPDEAWLQVMTRLLWIMLLYRAVQTTVSELLIGEVLGLDQKPAALHRWFAIGVRVVFGLLMLEAAIRVIGYREDVGHLVGFSLKAFAAVYALRLFALRDEVALLLPRIPDSGLYTTLRNSLAKNIHLVVGMSVLLVLLWAAGFSTAAQFILVRTYALIGLLLLSLFVFRRVQSSLHGMIRKQETPEGEPIDIERHRVLRSLERSLMTVGALVLVWGVLNILGVWHLLVKVASIPLFQPSDRIIISVYVVVKALFILSIFILLSRVGRAILNEKVYPKFEVEVGVGYAINTMLHYFLIVMGMLLSLNSIGLDLSAVAIFASALGIGIGFGLQDIVNNLISGFILLFGRSVKKGDYVTVHERFGRVDSVGARSVTITTPDNYELVIPSSELVSNSIVNWTLTSPYVRVQIPVGVTYSADVRQVKKVLLEAARNHPRVLKRPTPEVWLEGFGDSSVNFTLLVYIDCRRTNEARVKGELNYYVWDALAEADIEIPFPQRDLHVRSGFDSLEKLVDAYLEHRKEGLPPEVRARLEGVIDAQAEDKSESEEESSSEDNTESENSTERDGKSR